MAVSRLSQHSIQSAFPKGNTVWDGTTATSAFDSIGSVILSSNTATVTFSSIPQTYTHLLLKGSSRATTSGAGDVSGIMQFNSDTGTNYSWHRLYGYGGGTPAGADASASASSLIYGDICANGTMSSLFSPFVTTILDYTSTVKHKAFYSLTGFSNNANGAIFLNSGVWRPSSPVAITSLTLKLSDSTSYVSGSIFSLYGVK